MKDAYIDAFRHLDKSKLMTKKEVLAFLNENGENEPSLALISDRYETDFGINVVWKYPLSDDMHSGAFIVPVREGFLWVPFDEVDNEYYEILLTDEVSLLDAECCAHFQDTLRKYTDDLCTVLEALRQIEISKKNAAPTREQAEPIIRGIQPRAADEVKMFYRNDDAGNLCVGYLRGDFGGSGDEFWHNWFGQNECRNTPEFKAEFQDVMETLRQDVLKDYKSSAAYCHAHPDARLPGNDENYFGFTLETESRQYFVRCTMLRRDSFYVFAYNKAPLHETECEKTSV